MPGSAENSTVYVFDGFCLDVGKRLLYGPDGTTVPLKAKAFDTLLFLVGNAGRVIERDELLAAVWPDTVVEENNLTQHVSSLRRIFRERPDDHRFIATVPGRGYMFVAHVSGNASEPEEVHPPARYAGMSATQRTRRRLAVIGAAVSLVVAGLVLVNRFYRTNGTPSAAGDRAIMDLTASDDVHFPAISPDGKLFVYHTSDGERQRLMLQQIGQLSALQIMPATELQIHTKTFSPDGAYIYFSARSRHEERLGLYRIPTFGGSSKKVLDGIHDYSAISFSPDGREFVFSRYKGPAKGFSISAVRPDGTAERELISNGTEMLTYPSWSPDGRLVAFAHYFRAGKPSERHVLLEAVSAQGGSSHRLLDDALDNCFRIAWTSDGEGLVFDGTKLGEAMTGRRDQIWFVSLADGKMNRISPEGSRYTFGGLANDNSAIVGKVDRTSQIWVMDANGDSRTASQLTRGTTDGRTGLAPMPDGRVGYMTRNGDDWEIWIMNGDGSNPQQSYSDNPVIDELRATPDGRFFFFNGQVDRNMQLFRINTDGSGLMQLTSGDEVYHGDSTVSPDSRWVIYHTSIHKLDGSAEHSLQKVSIDGGVPSLFESDCRAPLVPHYSPDGRFISVIDHTTIPGKLMILPANSDSMALSFDVDKDALLNLGAVWTRDNSAVAYVVYQNKTSNIWLQPIGGGPPHQLTNFTSGHIHRIAYSMDSKRIYLARGYAINDALLIKGFVN